MSELLTIRPGVAFDKPAALSFMRMEAEKGSPIDVNRSTVSREEQQKAYDAYLAYINGNGPWAPLALSPDRSWHCEPIARAVDTDDDVWIRNHPNHGWRFVVASEKWHGQYYPGLDRHYGEDVNDMGTIDNTEQNYQVFSNFLFRALKWDVRDGAYGADAKNGLTMWDRFSVVDSSIAKIQIPSGTIDYNQLAKALTEQGITVVVIEPKE